eukprot:CAMPEP_0197900438 /NCGR_PEP_ID=MMETSP1439-20131203/49092_1 /TAXON_ID=66791 /ORGANISM="Gonyaulax spinifera, Strain CCMP409" /LENGTH=71 /DNA_ID=CAMNT_0043521323 /DNA_START=11 /DNA_END=223 /DNA_ORIENTATION=-
MARGLTSQQGAAPALRSAGELTNTGTAPFDGKAAHAQGLGDAILARLPVTRATQACRACLQRQQVVTVLAV